MWNEQKYDEIPHRVSETFVMRDPSAPAEGVPGPEREVHGRHGLRRFMEMVTTGFPDFEVTVFDMVATDESVMYAGQISATHEGPYDGLPPTGRQVEIPQMSKLNLKNGTIDEHHVYFDQMKLLEQLGLAFPDVIHQAPKLALKKINASKIF